MLYPFNRKILEALFIKIKEEIDLKADIELFAELSETNEGLIVGEDIPLDDPLVIEINAGIGDRVNIKAKIPTDENFTVNDAELLKQINEHFEEFGGLEAVLTSENIATSLDDANPQKVVSVTSIFELKSIYLKDKRYVNITIEEYNALSEEEKNNEEIIYRISGASSLYGLTRNQIEQIKQSYENLFINNDFYYASKKEIDDSKIDSFGNSFDTLQERLIDLDKKAYQLKFETDNLDGILDAYGVEVDFEEDNIERILKAKNLSSYHFNNIMPWAGIKRRNIRDGVLGAYCGEEGYFEDGSAGDVMVEIPKFYYKVIPIKLEPTKYGSGEQIVKAKWMVSSKPSTGFKLHPAFIRDNEVLDHIYIGAYEASVYDSSESKLLRDDEQVVDLNEDKFTSIAEAKPASGMTQPLSILDMRNLCINKGDGYELMNFTALSAIQLLFLIEYATFDSQTCIGTGIVNLQESEENNALKTGQTAELKNNSGTGYNSSVSYRGIENLWGNMRTYIDGALVSTGSDHCFHWTNTPIDIANEEYNKINFTLSEKNGYVSRIGYDEINDFVFLATAADATSNTGLNDAFMQQRTSDEWLGCTIADRCLGAQDGLFFINVSQLQSNSSYNYGGRIMFNFKKGDNHEGI